MTFVVGLDTALVNSGLVVLSPKGVEETYKPFPKSQFNGDEDSLFQTHRRLSELKQKLTVFISKYRDEGLKRAYEVPVFLAMEDYPMTGYQRSYKTAELSALIKQWCWENRIPYCLVHPLKTLKYVRKAKKVSKTEIIQYAKEHEPTLFSVTGVERADFSDIADAWAIGKVGQMVVESKLLGKESPLSYALNHTTWDIRWVEILTGDTGILAKPGLLTWSY